jgi:hypothetical protein
VIHASWTKFLNDLSLRSRAERTKELKHVKL